MDFSDITLLYIEDDQKIQEHIVQILSKRVKSLFVANNGREGLSLFEETNPDIIITDIKMPEMDGLTLSKKILEKNQDAKIIVTTAFTETEFLTTAIELGINNYTIKPIDTKQLLRTIERVVASIRQQKKEKELELQLKESQNNFRLISSIVSEFFYSAHREHGGDDEPFQIEWIGGAFQKITGYMPDEYNTFNEFKKFIHPDDHFKFLQILKRIESNKVSGSEFRIINQNQSLKTIKLEAFPYWDSETDTVTKVVGVVQDITEQARIQNQLETSEIKYRYLFQTIPLGIVFTTIGGQLIDCNDAFLNYTGLTRSEARTLNITRMYKEPEDRKILIDRIQNNDYVNYIKRFETTLIHKHGKDLPTAITASMIHTEGQQILLAIVQENKSAQGANQTIELLRKEIEKAAKTKELFLKIVNHDFHNPIGNILNLTDLLDKECPENQTLHHLRQSGESLHYQLDITAALASVCHHENLERKNIDLAKEIQKIIDQFPTSINSKKTQIQNLIPESMSIFANETVLELLKIFFFLSIKNIQNEGTISFSAEKLANGWKIFIEDNGKPRSDEFINNLRLAEQNSTEFSSPGVANIANILQTIARANQTFLWIEKKETGNLYFLQIPF